MRLPILLVALVSASPLRAAVISSAERLDATGVNPTFILSSSTNNFSPHTPIYYNTSFTYRNVPAYLRGADSLRTLFADSQDADYQLRLTLEVAATVFLVIDDRIEDVAGTMPWLATMGFTDTGDSADYIFSSSFVRTLSIYSASFLAGDVVLLRQDSPLVSGTLSGMYVVGAIASVPEPVIGAWLLLGAAGFLRRRRTSMAEE